jgi:hypothetical protein
MDDTGSSLPGAQGSASPAGPAFDRLLRKVGLTQDIEIDCTTCLEQTPIYVDRELADIPMAEEMPALHAHLMQCGDCYEEYEALRDLVGLDDAGILPDRAALLERLNAL